MNARLIVDPSPFDWRLARMEGEALSDLIVLDRQAAAPLGTIFRGRITAVRPELGGAFADLGAEGEAFLPLSRGAGQGPPPAEGECLLLQVTAEAYDEKAPRVDRRVGFPGRLLVLQHGRTQAGFSAAIADDAAKRRLASVLGDLMRNAAPELGGPWHFIARRGAAAAAHEAIAEEGRGLIDWARQTPSRDGAGAAPGRLSGPFDAVRTALAGLAALGAESLEILKTPWCEPAEAGSLRHLVGLMGVPAATRDRTGPDDPDLDALIDVLLMPEVRLPGGGRLTIETTRALTAIDVDSAETVLTDGTAKARAVNLEAARAIPRALGVRQIAGQVVIDFLSGGGRGLPKSVVETLREGFAADGAQVEMAPMGRFGLVALARQRSRAPLAHTMGGSAAGACYGPREAARRCLARIAAEQRARPGRQWQLALGAGLAAWLGQDPYRTAWQNALARLGPVALAPDHASGALDFEIRHRN